ncbi:MAG: hypothetical protein QMD22_09610 [archaeon]|nr:hypothetical protein [archaeon]
MLMIITSFVVLNGIFIKVYKHLKNILAAMNYAAKVVEHEEIRTY